MSGSGRAPLLILAALLAAPARAADKPFYELDEKKIARELKKIHKKNRSLFDRVTAVSARFVGTPYKLGPLGEGPDGEFDRDPLYDFTKVDCTTLVEEALALALKPDLKDAEAALQKIRYKDGKIGYATRNHFTEADWVPRNVWAGYLRDITHEIAGEKTVSVTKTVSKRDWYLRMSTANVEGRFTEAERFKRLPLLQTLGADMEDSRATLDVLPMDMLPEALAHIPSGTIANLVREPQPDKETIVSHQIFLIKDKQGRTFVRHAAAGKAVMDVPALEYFYRYYNSRWRLVGLNLNAPNDPAEHPAKKP